MNNLLRWRSLKVTLLFVISVFFLLHSSQAAQFIDISEFKFSHHNIVGIRVAFFNTRTQEYKYIGYHVLSSNTHSMVPCRLNVKFEDEGNFELFESGDIHISQEKGLTSDYIFRTKRGKIFIEGKDVGKFWDNRGILSNYAYSAKDVSWHLDISRKLRNVDSILQIELIEGAEAKEKKLSNLADNQRDNNDERGILGELATEMTLMAFGYTKLPSQNASNQGFDGVYIAVNKDRNQGFCDVPYLFLTESKCRSESKTAKKYLDEDLSEEQIRQKLQKTQQNPTSSIVTQFIKHSPQTVIKFAHRITDDGKGECCLQGFCFLSYSILTRKGETSLSNEEKLRATKLFMTQIGVSPLEMIRFSLANLKIDETEGKNLMSLVEEIEEKAALPKQDAMPEPQDSSHIKSLALLCKEYTTRDDPKKEWELGKQYEDAGQFDKAFVWYEKSASQGDASRQFRLGEKYQEKGRADEALVWYERCVAQKNPYSLLAMLHMADIYEERGELEEAFKCHLEHANAGGTCRNMLGWCYENGLGTTINHDEAFKAYKFAHDNALKLFSGDFYCTLNLANCYENGIGVDPSIEKAEELRNELKIAIEDGSIITSEGEDWDTFYADWKKARQR